MDHRSRYTINNSFHGNFVQEEMVKAFIISAEYRNRVGQ